MYIKIQQSHWINPLKNKTVSQWHSKFYQQQLKKKKKAKTKQTTHTHTQKRFQSKETTHQVSVSGLAQERPAPLEPCAWATGSQKPWHHPLRQSSSCSGEKKSKFTSLLCLCGLSKTTPWTAKWLPELQSNSLNCKTTLWTAKLSELQNNSLNCKTPCTVSTLSGQHCILWLPRPVINKTFDCQDLQSTITLTAKTLIVKTFNEQDLWLPRPSMNKIAKT